MIIECKTAGKEFEGSWKRPLTNGGQFFTYAKQAGSTRLNDIVQQACPDDPVGWDLR
jgi:type I restriction enzyme M protein